LFSFSKTAIASKVAVGALSQASIGKLRSAFEIKGGIRMRLRPLKVLLQGRLEMSVIPS
jgi:hypothetical protein